MLYQALQKQSQTRSTSVSGGGLFSLFGGTTIKGKAVTNASALSLTAFFNGVNIIANDIAKLPKAVYQKQGRNANKATDHVVNYLISKRPNQYNTSFMFHFVLAVDAILKGNGYARITKNTYTGKITSLELIDQDKTPVTVKKYDNKLWYIIKDEVLAADEVLHIPGFSFNGITGIGVVKFAAQSLGVALESQKFAEEYYSNKGIGLGIVTTSKDMDTEAKTRYANSLSNHLTTKAAGKFGVAVLDQMGSFQHIKISPQEALFLETTQNAIGEVARILNIPVYKLKDTQNQNNSNMEHQSISHVVDSILPWKIKFQQEYDYKLFSATEIKQGYYTKFNEAILLQADKKTQAEYYSKMVNIMAFTPDEVRALEDLNAIEGLDQPFVPVNMQTLEQLQLNKQLKEKELNTQNNE